MNRENASILQHYGILGMRWGVRKSNSESSSSDHKNMVQIRKKKLQDMTDDELIAATKRMKLVSDYKAAKIPRNQKPKKIHEMSNDELENGIKRGELIKEDWRHGVRKSKPIKKMTDEEVKKTLNRHLLEKPFKDLAKKEHFESIKKVLDIMVFSQKINMAMDKSRAQKYG